jgi:adenylate cyclase
VTALLGDASLVMLDGTWITTNERADRAASVILEFFEIGHQKGPFQGRQASSVTTALFTDIVGHTAMMSRLGDARGREILREHERITREILGDHDGTEVKSMGDGFVASFSSVASAIDCAIALQRAFSAHEDIAIRVGLNAGEPIAEDGDLFGVAVILASRICARAEAGEILIPEPVRHLLAGKSYTYTDRGEFIPKGFDDAVRLFEVRWQD